MHNSPSAPLKGLKVLDLTRLLPGPACTMQLADWGADVIKVEDPGLGDYARGMLGGDGHMSAMFALLNRRKRFTRLDLKQPDGTAQLMRWAKDADVLIESFRPGVMDKLGVGYTALKELNPRLVCCSISGYGQTGPLAQKAGHDINYLAQSGVLYHLTDRNAQPINPGFQIADLLGGAASATAALLAAVYGARVSGQGRWVDVSMTDTLFAYNVMALASAQGLGHPPAPTSDLLDGGVPCYGVYRCADGAWLAVGALEHKFWAGVCALLNKPEWTDIHWSKGIAPGSPASADLSSAFAALIGSQPIAHWQALFEPADVCINAVLSPQQAMDSPHTQHRALGLDIHTQTAQYRGVQQNGLFSGPLLDPSVDMPSDASSPLGGGHLHWL